MIAHSNDAVSPFTQLTNNLCIYYNANRFALIIIYNLITRIVVFFSSLCIQK